MTNTQVTHSRRVRRGASRSSRRGAAVILVLGLLAITLATTYALTRTQFRAFQIHSNSMRRGAAREAAANGLIYALRKMHDSDWGGVASSYQIDVSADQWFVVTYATGDQKLVDGDADYGKYPYRVTLTSIGYARNPMLPSAPTTHTSAAVVEFIPRQLSNSSPDWTAADAHTIRQWQASDSSRFEVEPRFRVEGNVYVQGRMQVCAIAPLNQSARQQWLGDLKAQYQQDSVDHRPFSGRVDLTYAHTSYSTRELLWDDLGLSTQDVEPDDTSYSHPGAVDTYQLYPGGQLYNVPHLASYLANIELKADTKTNPLGIFTTDDSVSLDDDVTIEGTLIVGGNDLNIVGDNVILAGNQLPVLKGSVEPLRLPTAIIRDDLRIDSGASGEFHGLLAMWDEFELKYAPQDNIGFSFDGRLLCRELLIGVRTEWSQLDSWWETKLSDFEDQEDDGEPLFCKWLGQVSQLPSQPILTIRPESGAVTYHWQDWSLPVFAAHPDDEGLRWQVVRWGENP